MRQIIESCLFNLNELSIVVHTNFIECNCGGDFCSFVGPHVRHVIEHYQAFLAALHGDKCIRYDDRARDLMISDCPKAAFAIIHAIMDQISEFDRRFDGSVCDEIMVKFHISRSSDAVRMMGSNIVRELHFVMHHAIHHCAMIRLHLDYMGTPVPADFGKAPATLAFENLQAG